MREQLWVPTALSGRAHSTNDTSQHVPTTTAIPGNPWIICPLWLAQYEIEAADTAEALARSALSRLDYAAGAPPASRPNKAIPPLARRIP